MSTRSLNRVQLIGNLTRDPELRFTPQGTAVCTFGLATNRAWTTESGEKREEAEFHRVVSWNKLAELCSQLLVKGRKVYVEGRLSTRTWTGQDGNQRTTTEVVIDDMILLDSRRPETTTDEGAGRMPAGAVTSQPAATGAGPAMASVATSPTDDLTAKNLPKATKTKKVAEEKTAEVAETAEVNLPSEEEKINPDDIPF